MKKISKVLAIVAVLAMVLSAVGCGSAAKAEFFQGRKAFVEAGYEGDCVNDVTTTLILNADKTYTLVENTSVCQVGGVVVAYWTYTTEGKYTEAKGSDENTKKISLEKATSCVYNMNGSVTTDKEDASLFDDHGAASTVTVDTTINAITE